ncbi:MAG TPA: hypothetical protein VML01_10335 [Bryobacterales bacterium]|nr:hypothetical protein [Bryobacterales bacterium]
MIELCRVIRPAPAGRALRSVTGDGVDFVIEIVDRIERHPSGKMRPYFSLLPPDPRDAEIGVTRRRSSMDDLAENDRTGREASAENGSAPGIVDDHLPGAV